MSTTNAAAASATNDAEASAAASASADTKVSEIADTKSPPSSGPPAAAPSYGDINVSAATSTEEGVAKLKALFNELDTDGDGGISSKEWDSSMETKHEELSKYFGESSLKSLGTLFSVLDGDSVTWEVFLAMAHGRAKAVSVATKVTAASLGVTVGDVELSAAMRTEEGVAALKNLFDELDKDGDGNVSSKEWGSSIYKNQDALRKHFGGSTLKSIGQLFPAADADGDDALDFEEFLALAQFRSEAAAASAATKAAEAPTEAVSFGDMFMSAIASTDEGVAKLKALFDELDKNGDGGISSKEWGSSIRKKQKELSKYFGGSSLKSIGKLFSVVDGDGDDSISWKEFLAMAQARGKAVAAATKVAAASLGVTVGDVELSAALNTEEGIAALKALFDELDKDGDGKVSSKEWGHSVYKKQDALRKYFGGSTLKSIGKLFPVADGDDNNALNWDEFLAFAKTRMAAAAVYTPVVEETTKSPAIGDFLENATETPETTKSCPSFCQKTQICSKCVIS